MLKLTPAQAAAYDAMKEAEAAWKLVRTGDPAIADAARAAYNAANAAYSALLPQRGSFHSRDNTAAGRSGRRQHAEQTARTAEALRRQQWRR